MANHVDAAFTTQAQPSGLKALVNEMIELWLQHWQRVLTFHG